MRPARLAARALALLGPVAGPVAVVAPRAGRLAAALAAQTALASDSAPPAAGIVSFLGAPAHPADRQAALRLLGQRLPAGAPLVLVRRPETFADPRPCLGSETDGENAAP